eukprot:CAMPEP_0115249644 /NCGR_PEP_ID=MMETSP0270-20121206/42696_1 /TAXON_ID=71861 /ORGANISM="Scrippsiella trochoidea, Strain CCMP3099" /LENGTH=288 /DNA_ID=CAMNT_0002664991 /DNA_START=55 /DNA_END=921 /DNA_ORIENTATION=+
MASAKPSVNLSDIPELMPGAQPSANPAQRETFEQRCRQLYAVEAEERRAEVEAARAAAGLGPASACSELEAMFPNLDPTLIRALCADAPSEQSAIDTLLALAAASAEPHTVGDAVVAAPVVLPSLNVGLEDHENFPALVDAEGWQVGSQRQFELAEKLAQGEEEDLGSAWRDQAQAAADIPAPPAKAWGPAKVASAMGRKRGKEEENRKEGEEPSTEAAQPMTDYEFRQHVGQRRARHRVQFGSRGARRTGKGPGSHGAGCGPTAAGGAGSESELSEEEVVGTEGLAA